VDALTSTVLGFVGVTVVGIIVVVGAKVAQQWFGIGKDYVDDLEDELKLTRERYARIEGDLQAAQAALATAQQHLDAANREIADQRRENDRLRAENLRLRTGQDARSMAQDARGTAQDARDGQ
jgi:chromosome segregation ATPase